jgi:hypothetical protein
VDEFSERPFVGTIAIGRIKTAKAAAAQCAAALFIQREPVLERRSATATEEFSVQWLGLPEAMGTDGDAGDFGQGLAAEAAIVGKEQGKKGVRGCADC